MTVNREDSIGRSNTPSMEVWNGTTEGLKYDDDGPGTDAFAGRPGVSRDVQRLFWAGVAKGLTSEDAALACGVSPVVGTRWFRDSGGMPQISLTVSGRYLSLAEREDIALMRAQDVGVREIACRLGRSASTISRELRRNAATRGGKLQYRASTAQWKAERQARRPKPAKLAVNERLRTYVQHRLDGRIEAPDGRTVPGPDVAWGGRRHGRRKDRRWATSWSLEQIAGRLPVDFPEDESMRISHEAIYQGLYVQARGGLRRELTAHRAHRAHRTQAPRPDQERKALRQPRGEDRPAAPGGRGPDRCRPLGRGSHSRTGRHRDRHPRRAC